MDDKKFLEAIKSGDMTIDQGLDYLKDYNFKDLGFAKLDFQRKSRRAFGEVVYGENKDIGQLLEIAKSFIEKKEDLLITRLSPKRAAYLKENINEINYDKLSQTARLCFSERKASGEIAICTGGNADMKVAEEARICAEFFGAKTRTFYDIGVSGIHRLLANRKAINEANVIIAIAGMEGALPTIIAGLVDKPIIAVPTSVGYGANFKGVSALLTMLNSCAEGVSVVNIDNGYGAAYAACQINRLIEGE